MAFYSVCLSRRSLMSLSSSLLHRNLHQHHLYGASSRRISMLVSSTSTNMEAAERRPTRSNSSQPGSLLSLSHLDRPSDMKFDINRIPSDMKLDKNHWVVDIRFEEDLGEDEEEIRREEMVELYVSMAAKVFGSVEEANKRIYSYCTTNYYDYCFRVECSEDTSLLFRRLPGVTWVGPDLSYLKSALKKHNRIAESKKRGKQIAESKKHRKKPILCKKRVIISAGPSPKHPKRNQNKAIRPIC